jgi:hypothetical protein
VTVGAGVMVPEDASCVEVGVAEIPVAMAVVFEPTDAETSEPVVTEEAMGADEVAADPGELSAEVTVPLVEPVGLLLLVGKELAVLMLTTDVGTVEFVSMPVETIEVGTEEEIGIEEPITELPTDVGTEPGPVVAVTLLRMLERMLTRFVLGLEEEVGAAGEITDVTPVDPTPDIPVVVGREVGRRLVDVGIRSEVRVFNSDDTKLGVDEAAAESEVAVGAEDSVIDTTLEGRIELGAATLVGLLIGRIEAIELSRPIELAAAVAVGALELIGKLGVSVGAKTLERPLLSPLTIDDNPDSGSMTADVEAALDALVVAAGSELLIVGTGALIEDPAAVLPAAVLPPVPVKVKPDSREFVKSLKLSAVLAAALDSELEVVTTPPGPKVIALPVLEETAADGVESLLGVVRVG